MKSVHLIGSLAVATGLAIACRDGQAPVAPTGQLGLVVPSGSVQAVLEQQAPSTDGTITLIVRVVSNGVGVSAYQGAVTFEPGAFTLVSTTAPDAGSDESHVLNAVDFDKGRIRFAAFTATTFKGTQRADGAEAFRFTVKARRPVEDARLSASLDVVGTEAGTAVAPNKVLPSKGVLTSDGHTVGEKK